MPEPEKIIDADFDSQLRGLFQEAEEALVGQAAAAQRRPAALVPPAALTGTAAPATAAPGSGAAQPLLPAMLKPLLLGIEALSRATGENTALLRQLALGGAGDAEARTDLPSVAADLRAVLEMKNGVTQGMFSALHEELRTYKDAFLLDSVHRPIIRDLITLFDDLSATHRQLQAMATEMQSPSGDQPVLDRVGRTTNNLAHNLEFIIEVLARLEVTPMPVSSGALNKATHRVTLIEKATSPDQDGQIVRSVKPGFLWKDRILRPEEVVVWKWKESVAGEEALGAAEPPIAPGEPEAAL